MKKIAKLILLVKSGSIGINHFLCQNQAKPANFKSKNGDFKAKKLDVLRIKNKYFKAKQWTF